MTEDLSTAQRLQMAAMTTDALSNLIERSKHLCHSVDPQTEGQKEHCRVLRDTVLLTAATLTETIQDLTPALKVVVADATTADVDEDALARAAVAATVARL